MAKNAKLTDFFKAFVPSGLKRRLPLDEEYDSIHVDSPTIDGTGKSLSTSDALADEQTPQLLNFAAGLGSADQAVAGLGLPHSQSANGTSRVTPAAGPPRAMEQRVIKNGQVIIKSSDDEDSSSCSSLENLDQLLGATKSSPQTHLPQAAKAGGPSTSPALRQRAARKPPGQRGISAWVSASARLPDAPRYKFSLDSLVQQSERDTAGELDVAEARSMFNTPVDGPILGNTQGQQDRLTRSNVATSQKVEEGLLQSVVLDSEEGSSFQKVLDAMRRTEALRRSSSWSFFQAGNPHSNTKLNPFPIGLLDAQGWGRLLTGWLCWDVVHRELD